jgi:hypothetical protein
MTRDEILEAVLIAFDSITELHAATLDSGEFLSDELLRRVKNQLTVAELVAKGRLMPTAWHRDGQAVYVTAEDFTPGVHDVFLWTEA